MAPSACGISPADRGGRGGLLASPAETGAERRLFGGRVPAISRQKSGAVKYPQEQTVREARRVHMAIVEGRVLARKLRGLPQDEVAVLMRTFINAFLGDLLRQGDVQAAAVLDVAHLSMDLVIERQKASAIEEPHGETSPPDAPISPA